MNNGSMEAEASGNWRRRLLGKDSTAFFSSLLTGGLQTIFVDEYCMKVCSYCACQ